MKIKKSQLKRIIKEGIKVVLKENKKPLIKEGVVRNLKPKKVSLKIPSFTVKAKLSGYETDGTGMIKQPVNIEIDSFENDFADQLAKIMPKVIAKAANAALDANVSDNKPYIGGTMSGIPKYFSFNKK